jgi:hypothetical protein
MKATIRSAAAAAAMLLAPISALLVSQPAAAQHAYGYAQPAVVAPGEFRGERWDQRHGRDDRRRRDDSAPQISELTPSHGDRVGARGWTQVSAHFSDQGSGVDMGSLVLRVDGRDVTRRARVDGDDIRYAEDLQPGRHVAELVVRDRAGNASRRSWTFDVVGQGRGNGAYSFYDGRR